MYKRFTVLLRRGYQKPQENRNSPLQLYTCQEYAHTRDCYSQHIGCVKCVEYHLTKKCTTINYNLPIRRAPEHGDIIQRLCDSQETDRIYIIINQGNHLNSTSLYESSRIKYNLV
jgi:hypothetical protein